MVKVTVETEKGTKSEFMGDFAFGATVSRCKHDRDAAFVMGDCDAELMVRSLAKISLAILADRFEGKGLLDAYNLFLKEITAYERDEKSEDDKENQRR